MDGGSVGNEEIDQMWPWISQADLAPINSKLDAMKVQLTAIKAAIALIGKLTPDQQANLNKIFDTASGDSAKIDAAIKSPKNT